MDFDFWKWVREEAELIDADGCSAVLNIHECCCFEHDLGYFYDADPREVYRRVLRGTDRDDAWDQAPRVGKAFVDARFRRCLQTRSVLGMWSPMAWWRWLGVKRKGQGAWDRHRAAGPSPLRHCHRGTAW